MCDSNERWRPVENFEGLYEVSNMGRVRSVARVVTCLKGKRMIEGRVLKGSPGSTGYAKVELCDGERIKTDSIHRLVAIAFVPGTGRVVRHLDGTRTNDFASNLAWGSYKDNEDDKKRHGRTAKGVGHGMAKLTTKQVGSILDMHDRGFSQLKISSFLHVCRGTIGYLVRGQSYVKEVKKYRLAQRSKG